MGNGLRIELNIKKTCAVVLQLAMSDSGKKHDKSQFTRCSRQRPDGIQQLKLEKTRKLCYRKDDRAMRPIYRLFYHNFAHAYVHYFVRIWFW